MYWGNAVKWMCLQVADMQHMMHDVLSHGGLLDWKLCLKVCSGVPESCSMVRHSCLMVTVCCQQVKWMQWSLCNRAETT